MTLIELLFICNAVCGFFISLTFYYIHKAKKHRDTIVSIYEDVVQAHSKIEEDLRKDNDRLKKERDALRAALNPAPVEFNMDK